MIEFPKDDMSHDDPDFGEDAGAELPNDSDFDAWITKAAPLLNAPTATPRLAMWDAIEAARPTSDGVPSISITGVTPLRRTRWMWPVAVAAALLVGVGIDRYSMRSSAASLHTVASRRSAASRNAASATAASDTAISSRLYRLAAQQTFTQAEALLTAYRASDVAARNPDAARQLGTWGREVLSSTRLLLDSPAGDDPQLRPLLNDIELVLVQIIRLSGAPLDSSDRALIDGAMRERDLLPRIRTAVPAGVAGAASDE